MRACECRLASSVSRNGFLQGATVTIPQRAGNGVLATGRRPARRIDGHKPPGLERGNNGLSRQLFLTASAANLQREFSLKL
jgi:hypothetical protein